MKNWFRLPMLAIQIVGLLAFTQSLKAQTLRKATFELKNEITVQVPDGAKRVRVWTALPQDDPAQEIKNLKIDAPYPYRVELDSEGSKVLFIEGDALKAKELKIVTSFVLTRWEVRSGVDAKQAKPLSEADRARLAHYLQPNKHVIIDGDIRKLALQIVAGAGVEGLDRVGKRRVLGQRSEEQKGIAGWQHDVLSDFPHRQLHRFRIALDVVCAQHRNPDADRLRFLS